MESQESDICPADDMEVILKEPGVEHLMEGVDWSSVNVPETLINPTGEMPARTEWPGEHFFDAKVDLSGTQKKNYVYSFKLHKLFLDLGKVVPFQIKWDGHPGLYVRAMMLFNLADQMKDPVMRCVVHRDKHNPTNYNYNHHDHVLASETDHAKYEVDELSNRHSVVVPLHLQHGCDHALISYKFMCKTSCASGINRSPTDVVFTLEDENGTVLGRQRIGVKICSCPKRDKDKEEENEGEPHGKRKMKVKKEEKEKECEPPIKKIKQEHFNGHSTSTSFMIQARSPQVAQECKNYLQKWCDVMSVHWTAPGMAVIPAINIIEDVALLPQPYL